MQRYQVNYCASSSADQCDWSTAEVLADFSLPWESAPPPPTEFRALWNQENFYFRFECEDKDLVLATGATSSERVLGSDRVEIFLATDLNLDPYYGFEMEPRGEMYAYRARHYRQFEPGWSPEGFEFSAEISRSGYTVCGSISIDTLHTLNVMNRHSQEFYAGVYRAEFSHHPDGSIKHGWMPWVNPRTPKADFHVPESFGLFYLD